MISSLASIQARIEARKRKLAESTSAAGPAKRWRTKGDIEAEAERAYLAASSANCLNLAHQPQESKLQPHPRSPQTENPDDAIRTDGDPAPPAKPRDALAATRPASPVVECSPGSMMKSAEENLPPAKQNPPLKKDEVLRRLRACGEPATLFGEDDWQRFQRLRGLELARGGESRGQLNVFQNKLREMQRKDAVRDAYQYSGAVLPQSQALAGCASRMSPSNGPISGKSAGDMDEDRPSCPEDYVYRQMRRWVRMWEDDVLAMPPESRRSNQGRTAAATLEQTKEWLKPLSKQLRKRRLAPNILRALVNIFEAVEEREYVRANSHYYEQLAIGNAPWPMGATMVGIHARAAREKIGEDKIAHVMNDEKSRKYIQGIKRLVTLAQRHFPTDPSKMIQS
jgi:pre-mRNA-splicing factor 18